MTDAMKSALLWLKNRNSDGVFDKSGVLLAGGERAPVMRATWNRLVSMGLAEYYMGKKRIRISDAGQAYDLSGVEESYSVGY